MERIADCECQNWTRTNVLCLTKHHPSCPKYNYEQEVKDHLEALLKGIVIWASDEDGIHDQVFDIFRSAAFLVGKPELVADE
jgi:hypothetical protein